jgi:hypothetical protein
MPASAMKADRARALTDLVRMRQRSALAVLVLGLAAAGCSSYAVRSDAVRPAAPRMSPQPLRVAVAVPDVGDPTFIALGDLVTTILRELYFDFISGLEGAGVFATVEQVPFSTAKGPDAGGADVLATMRHRPGFPEGGARRLQQILVLFSLFRLAPILEAHETFTITAELLLTRPLPPTFARRYVGTGTATLTSKINAPRDRAVRDAFVAAGRAANAQVVAQLARDDHPNAWRKVAP